ncbi:SusC/RagA family TonB-linked outer membrane protein [Flagellimonas algicola]|uniref:SusC/RagA family TonB-linked outer membrane protein n=1 Tax=Flagellimonas algicola TaxID=2583815 RepID=A0ABY2WLS8_9FLAO|nr:SusC/RagA family TonB-linked outer membrane protein [Allomuricauda algicola]TMU55476.1 SusC/RagA family TonB-linked outer membrane protein [Allomuricauda algicola]
MKITLLKSILLSGAFLCFGLAKAQTVSGTVTDVNGPLPGASVLVKGTTNGTQTDFDGNYTLSGIDDSSVMVFSYIGYTTQEIAVNGQTTINVTLQEDAQALDEVVIIGYGTTTVKDATGAVASVTAEDFNGGVISSPEQLIQGKTAGVQITQTSGEPGAGVEFRIRGTNSVRSNNNPLFVVDGVPLAGDDTSATGQGSLGLGSSAAKNPLNFLNPSDIESISILKDASATAIYGSRGANGVVIITTKSGKAGSDGVFEFSSSLSFSKPANEYTLLNREQFLAGVAQFGGVAADQDFGANTDWQDIVTRNATSHNQNISWSKNYGKGNIRATFGYQDQFGVIEESSLERITGRANWTHRFLDDKLRLNVQATVSRVNDESPPISGSAGFNGDLLGAAYSANPTWPTDVDFAPGGGLLSPSNLLHVTQSTAFTNRFLANVSLEYDFTPELTGKVTYGYDTSESTRKSGISRDVVGLSNGTSGNGRAAVNDINVANNLLEATLTYKKELENSFLDVLVGFSYQDFGRDGRNIQGWGFNTSNLDRMGDDLERSANTIESNISGRYQQYGIGTGQSEIFINRLFPSPVTDNISSVLIDVRSIFTDTFDFTDELQSFFGRVNYSIADKYLFTGTIRADGSSRFGPDNQYGYFPSGAFAWKLHEEDFMGDAFSTLKLRVSGGITGNQEGLGFGNFVRRERYTTNPAGDIQNAGEIAIPGTQAVSFVNNQLKWEETLSYGVGLDFGFNNDRLSGTIDVYRKETTDLLLSVPAAQPSPQPFFFQNLDATVLNQGVEFSIAYDFAQSEDFNLSTSFNISYNENELQDFGGQIPAGTIRGQGLSLAFAQILAGDQPLFSYFLREFGGFDSNGQPIGDVQGFVGEDALPDVIAGFSLNTSYKNWDFSAYFTGQFGFSVYNNTANAFFTAGSIANARNVTPNVLTSGEAGNAAAEVSTRFLEKGDFVRFQNASLGYNVPLSGTGAIKSLRLSLTGQNLFLITDYSGLDPEVSVSPANNGLDLLNGLPTAGIDLTAFPRPRTFTFGVNATF